MALLPATLAKDRAVLGAAVVVGMIQTSNHKDTVVVAYPPGAYGTFLEWCLTYFTGDLPAGPQSWPFVDRTGSAHRFRGNQIKKPSYTFQTAVELSGMDTYLAGNQLVRFARTHADNQDMQEFINCYRSQLNNIVYIQPAENNFLLLINNVIDKISAANGIKDMLHTYVREGQAPWEVRESISNFIKGTRNYYSKYYTVNHNCIVVELNQLIANLEGSLDRLFDQVGLCWSDQHRADLDTVAEKWLGLQKHLDKDLLCQNIINATLKGINYSWQQQVLSRYDEAYIQWALRDLHGLDMRCYNVNAFPTNTTDLRNLLINE